MTDSNSFNADKLSTCPLRSRLAPEEYGQRWDLDSAASALCSKVGYSEEDLASVARFAWRNSTRCIGRALWKTLRVVDARSIDKPDEIFEALLTHLRESTHNGQIKSTMTVFPEWRPDRPTIRIWNHQLLRYAGYETTQGKILGDPMNRDLTRVALRLGWTPPRDRSAFDLLPLIIQVGDALHYYELPSQDVLEVNIRHPEYAGLAEMNLKWYANPIISDMIFATGSAIHGCAPFNGHYMLTEIATRNFGDEQRYNLLPEVAEKIGLTCSPAYPLWRDRALVALAEAVQWSFDQAGVTLIDHHRAAQGFSKFCQHEMKHDREVQAAWDWIVPPLSGSSTPVFHASYSCQPVLPNFLLQTIPWACPEGQALVVSCSQGGTDIA